MTAVVVLASITMGAILGAWITMIVTTALNSRAQERLHHQALYWQAQAVRTRAAPTGVVSENPAAEGQPPGRKNWPHLR